MIFRRYAGHQVTKTHMRLSGLHRIFKPWHEAVIRGGSIKTFLCPRIRNNECSFFNANGEDLERWLRKNAKGCFALDVHPDPKTNFIQEQKCDIRVRFTDRDSALMFKLQMGGR
jgi:hypothetical protein